jgi:hypothetical protein
MQNLCMLNFVVRKVTGRLQKVNQQSRFVHPHSLELTSEQKGQDTTESQLSTPSQSADSFVYGPT